MPKVIKEVKFNLSSTQKFSHPSTLQNYDWSIANVSSSLQILVLVDKTIGSTSAFFLFSGEKNNFIDQ
ncbi:hypothetical protein Ahy_B10g106255 isoform D [Arachis hypogaea]|uniref:Uncharacterized protein n=1 Tax=Arachis hypogaea TaxID=3818 RepID=A0A444XA94_ARAHY|nr:hypothetical protein Ahy_B10g106255 isoform D [Arachis hypogaea]